MSEAVAHVPFQVVAGTPAAWPFVLTTWMRSYAESDFARHIKPGVFHAFHHAIATKLLQRCELRLAVDNDDPNLYLGWALSEPGVLHYVWVKPQFELGSMRALGVREALMEGLAPSDVRFTHHTRAIVSSLPKSAVYNPYLL